VKRVECDFMEERMEVDDNCICMHSQDADEIIGRTLEETVGGSESDGECGTNNSNRVVRSVRGTLEISQVLQGPSERNAY